jgi:O-antigen/teichoic acid export membrane protein
VIVLLLHGGLVALGVVTVTIGLGGQIARFLMARRLIPGLHISFRAFDRTILRSFLTVTGWFTLDEITTSVIGGVDLVIVGIVVGVREAGIFAVAQRLATIPVQTGYPPAAVAFPYAGQLAGRGDSAGMRLITNRVTRQVMALTVPVALVVMTLSVPAVRAWVGPEFHQSAELAVILCAAVIFHALALAPRAVVSGSGHPKVPTTVGTIEAGTHVVLGVILCRQFGVIGAAYTALACAVFFKCIILVPLLYRRLGLSVLKEYASVLRAHGIPLVIAGALGLYLARNPLLHFVDTHGRAWSIIAVMIAGILVAVLYYAILLFTGTNGPERAGILATVRTRLHLR